MWSAEHHFRNLQRGRDALTEVILALRSATERLTGDDWIDAMTLLNDIENDIAPRLSRLRTRASDRFDEITRRPDFEQMRSGELPFPDERPTSEVVAEPVASPHVASEVPALPSANARIGSLLAEQYGGVDKAMMVFEPDTEQFDHLQAFRYLVTGKRPKHWIPPTVRRDDDG